MATRPVTESGREPSLAEAVEDAARQPRGVYHFLDVGGRPYGDCTVVEFGKIRVLIDGSHQQDYRGQPGYPSTPEQLDRIFGTPRPHRFDVVVVTHGHDDHIGCLPLLLSNNVITADLALLTDPKMGFGRTPDEDSPVADSMSSADLLAVLLREEDVSFLTDAEIQEFLDSAITVEERYRRFIEGLEAAGTQIVYYRGQPLDGAIAERLAPTGAQVLGPSLDQLLLCAEQISKSNKEAQDLVADRAVDGREDVISLYRAIALSDRSASYTRGNAMNCQSITIAFGPPGAKALLAGDMQFSEPGIRGGDDEVAALRKACADAGPYKLFKTTHHTSHNGQDDELLKAFGRPPFLVHSGGAKDADHPYPSTLKLLSCQDGTLFARTDRNGRVTVRPHLAPNKAITIERGELNDYSPNVIRDTAAELETMTHGQAAPESAAAVPHFPAVTTSTAGAQIIIVNLPPGAVDMSVAGIDIVVREPPARSNAARIPPGGSSAALRAPEPGGSDPDRQRLASLLFVTDSGRLRHNIGQNEADRILASIRRSGAELIDGPGPTLGATVAQRLRSGQHPRGVVIVGGYDVVPPRRLDVLGPALRQRLTEKQVLSDSDQFIIWSDATYGDDDGDNIAEIPVSRIPDGRDPALIEAALASRPPRPTERFGIRNVARPFAENVFGKMTGSAKLGVSEPLLSRELAAARVSGDCHYLMLHGSHRDARTFVGEYLNGAPNPVAFDVSLVPRRFDGIVFTGCCWGALPVDRRASDSGDPAPRLPEDSIALAYLKAGANSFVGCTGSHYSGPSTDPDANFAARLHEAFWALVKDGGKSPAEALFEARNTYMEETLRRRFTPLDTARRVKNFAQFTCLGLGW